MINISKDAIPSQQDSKLPVRVSRIGHQLPLVVFLRVMTIFHSTNDVGPKMTDFTLSDQPEAVLELPEEYYKYGIGPIVLRNFRVVTEVEFDGVRWWRVSGEVANGTKTRHGDWLHRELYVATLALYR